MSIRTVAGDAAFMAFQEKLATVVAGARARGLTVGDRRRHAVCVCPLGAHPASHYTHPSSPAARDGGWAEVSQDNLREFINGYGGGSFDPGSPYAQLGQLYRELYP